MRDLIRLIAVVIPFLILHAPGSGQNVPLDVLKEQFLRECDEVNVDSVKRLLAAGVPPNSRDRFGQPALFRVLRDGPRKKYTSQAEVVGVLIAAGADVNAVNQYGSNALFLLTGTPAFIVAGDVYKLLIKSGIKPDHRDKWGLTFLEKAEFSTAERRGDPEVLWRYLLEGNLAMDSATLKTARHSSGATFAMAVAYYGESYQQPLEFRASGDVDRDGETNLFYMASRRSFHPSELAEISRSTAKIVSKSGETALIRAARFNNDQLVVRLLASGADPEVRDKTGRNALDYSAEYDHYETTLALLTRADANAKGLDGATPLMTAARFANKRTLAAFVNAKRMVSEFRAGKLPGGQASDAELIRALERIDVNIRDGKGMTALMHAVVKGDAEAVDLILRLSPNLSLKDKEGRTALSIARQAGNSTIINLLDRR